jgi:hypothetical protein
LIINDSPDAEIDNADMTALRGATARDAISADGLSTPHAGMRAMEERVADVKGEKRIVSSRRIKLRSIQPGALDGWHRLKNTSILIDGGVLSPVGLITGSNP